MSPTSQMILFMCVYQVKTGSMVILDLPPHGANATGRGPGRGTGPAKIATPEAICSPCLHCLVLDGVYKRGNDGAPEFVEVPEPTDEALQAVLRKIITRLMKLLTCRGVLVEEEGSTYVADSDSDSDSDEARVFRPRVRTALPSARAPSGRC